jgi:hypothetical protein
MKSSVSEPHRRSLHRRPSRRLGRSRRWGVIAALAWNLLLFGAARLEAQDEIQERIRAAIERGRRHLEGQLQRLVDDPPGDHPMGRIALPLAAVLKAGMPSQSPLSKDAFGKLYAMAPSLTYDVACYLFALDALWQRQYHESRDVESTTGVLLPRMAKGKVLDKMTELVEWLVDARARGQGAWTYGKSSGGYDYSNSQFAILGLQVGIENGIRIPKEVFIEIANHFLRTLQADGRQRESSVTFNPPAEAAFTRTYVARTVRYSGKPAGWNYSGNDQKPYPSMTAAGASSLLVAREGLDKLGGWPSGLKARLEQGLHGAMAWITQRFGDYMKGGHHYYYTLYSLEKVGDLGDVLRFGDHDWYLEGARELLERQGGDGSWGNYVDTSFALLFLTRATRPHLRSQPPPTILTVSGNEKDQARSTDLVFVDDLDAFISAREFFAYLKDLRKSALLPIAEQVLRNFSPDHQEELVPYLASLLSKQADAITSFARKALGDITGWRGKDRDAYLGWHRHYRAVVEFVSGRSRDLETLGALFAGTDSVRIKSRLLDLIERESLVAAGGVLAQEMLIADPAYRERVHGILTRFTDERAAFDPSQRKSDLEAAASRWQAWWAANGQGLLARHRIRELVERLNRREAGGEAGAERATLLESLIGEGRECVPSILDAMRGGKYRVELVLALERISGESMGFGVERWQRWWEAQKK